MQKDMNEKFSFPAMEEAVLNFWDKAKIFEKSVTRDAPQGDYVFYDGPPFGTGEPHYGHILSSVSKDVVPRFWTMRGYRVERKWGWDCHGLPIENIIEKDLGVSGKKDIEEKVGIAKFNEACRARVLEYADIWDVMVRRIGRWVDFKNSYKTMDKDFMESVWWGFSELYKKDLIYEGRKVLLYCTRCETPISNFEVAMDNSYKDVTDTSLYIKFKVKNAKEKLGIDDDLYILAWTTTPWTLPGNVALAVGKDIDYLAIKIKGEDSGKEEILVLAKDRMEDVIVKNGIEYEEAGRYKGRDLLGLEYEPLFDIPAIKAGGKKGYYVVAGDFVTTADGAGVVHIAPVYGEDDYKLGLKYDLPIVPGLDEKGHFNETVVQFQGAYFKKANGLIIEDLQARRILFKEEKITHSYPHCHRCDTPLIYNAIPAWFINIEKIRQSMIAQNENINWYPEHLKNGRFGKGLETAPDWNISRNRYFATPIPIWKCDKCKEIEIIGSVAELREKSGKSEIKDIHSHFIDDISWACAQCGGAMRRIPEVFDCWVESGSMPFAQMHYPFENKERFEKNYPAQFISEYISQTRAWFYVMHVLATALFGKNSYKNVIATGVILNDKGEKMSKSKKNFPDPNKIINDFGADALRLYLMGSTVMYAENLFFDENEVKEIFRKNIMLLWNVYSFFAMYVNPENITQITDTRPESDNVLDQWIVARLDQLISEVTASMENYDMPRSARPITGFIDDLSTWYIRRSRDRFKGSDEKDKEQALATTRYVLIELSKVMAPFAPFIAEQIWQKVTGYNFKDENKSVHLEIWPAYAKASADKPAEIITEMEIVRKIVELGLAKRDEAKIKIRQPIASLKFKVQSSKFKVNEGYCKLLRDEMNVMVVAQIDEGDQIEVEIDTALTPELKMAGLKRDIVRQINMMRKNAGLTINDRIVLCWQSDNQTIKDVFTKLGDEIKKDTLSDRIEAGFNTAEFKQEIKIAGESVVFGINKL